MSPEWTLIITILIGPVDAPQGTRDYSVLAAPTEGMCPHLADAVRGETFLYPYLVPHDQRQRFTITQTRCVPADTPNLPPIAPFALFDWDL